MTTNKRAKRDARERQERTGERYVAARRRSARRERMFEDDCCANCLERLPDDVDGLFCCELCMQTADTVRYWRRVVRDSRADQPDVRDAVRTRVAFLLAGGYGKAARRLPSHIRDAVWRRDDGLCGRCGQPGEEIDHVDGDSAEMDNLQLLCKSCHHAKTRERMRPATPEQQALVAEMYANRVLADVPALLADDQDEWQRIWSKLKKARRQRLLDNMVEVGLDPADYRRRTRAEMVDALADEMAAYDEAWDDEYSGDPGSFDGGYGPNSYFAHAMAKDD